MHPALTGNHCSNSYYSKLYALRATASEVSFFREVLKDIALQYADRRMCLFLSERKAVLTFHVAGPMSTNNSIKIAWGERQMFTYWLGMRMRRDYPNTYRL